MKKENIEEQDSFFNQLKNASKKKWIEEFLEKGIHGQIQELDYSLGRTKDRIKELGFERERITNRINSMLHPSQSDRYGIEAMKGLILAHKRFENKRKSKPVNKNRKRSFLVSLSRKLVQKKKENKNKFFSGIQLLSQKRVDPIKLSSRLKEIDFEIANLKKAIQWHKEEIQIKKEMILESGEYEPYLHEKPKYTPSILYDKKPPQIKEVKKNRQEKVKEKKRFSKATLKICILGEQGVGITTWLSNFSASFNIREVENYKLRNYEFGVKLLKVNNIAFKLQLWFLNAHRLFKKRYQRYSLTFENLIRGCNGAILVYDITSIKTFNRIPEWIHSIRETCGDIPILLLGNKCDIESLREISKEQANDFVKKYNLCGCYEISVKTGKNLDLPFQKISELWLQKYVELEKEYDR
ncbi:MAG: Rab family GTPase [Promethearchaeota archaeon]